MLLMKVWNFVLWNIRLFTDVCVLYPGFEWDTLETNALVVDVGGGIGAQSMTIAKKFPHLRIIVQDREQTVKDAVSVRISRTVIMRIC